MKSDIGLYMESVMLARCITGWLIAREISLGDLWDDYSQKGLRVGKRAWERAERRKRKAHGDE